MAFPFDVLSWLVRLRYKLTPPVAADGDTVELQGDVSGNIKARIMAEGPPGLAVVRQLDAAKRGTLKAAPGSLFEITIWNKGSDPVWFQVHDKGSGVNDADVCLDQIFVPAGATVGWRPVVPVACATQIRWAASSTPKAATILGTDEVGFSAAVL